MAVAPGPHEQARVAERSFVDRSFSRMDAGSVRGSVFSLCSSAIGSGVLLLPFTFGQVGPLVASISLALGACAGYVSLRICCAGMYVAGTDSYVATLGALWSSKWLVGVLTFMLVLSCFGQTCGYFVFAAQLLQQLLRVLGAPRALCTWWVVVIVIACFPALPLSLWRKLSDFRYLTLVTFLGLSYLTLLVVGRMPYYVNIASIEGQLWRVPNVWDVPLCWSLGFYAYVTHMNVFSTYAELANPTSIRIVKVINRSVTVETILYVTVAIFGFLSFGAGTPDNILLAYDETDALANMGRFFVFLQLNVSIPLTVFPGRTQLWALLRLLSRKRPAGGDSACDVSLVSMPCQATLAAAAANGHTVAAGDESALPKEPGTVAHVVISTTFLALAALVAVLVPSASDLMGIVGGFSCVTYVCLLPAELARKLRAEHAAAIPDSPAAFIAGPRGAVVIGFLRACTLLGYCAAGRAAWSILGGGK